MGNDINPKIRPIANGTVLDHLPAGSAMKILEILKDSEATISVATNIDSTRFKKKDLVYIDGHKLDVEEIAKIGLIASGSTLNVIKDSKIQSKNMLKLPISVEGVIPCLNEKCITNYEAIETKFVIRKDPVRAKCFYCEKEFSEQEIRKML